MTEILNMPETWKPEHKLFPYQVGFTCPPFDFDAAPSDFLRMCPKSVGVLAAAKMGANPYPMLPHMSLMHGALGSEIVDFLQGKESAEQALADVEAAYIAKAKEKGFL